MNLTLIKTPTDREKQDLDDLLMDYNRSESDGFAYDEFLYKFTDSSDTMIAGIHAEIGNGWLCVISLWVEKTHRKNRLGEKLLQAAEKKAMENGCHGSYLYTYTFQAPGFYEKYGYEIFGKLEDFSANNAKLFMKKNLL